MVSLCKIQEHRLWVLTLKSVMTNIKVLAHKSQQQRRLKNGHTTSTTFHQIPDNVRCNCSPIYLSFCARKKVILETVVTVILVFMVVNVWNGSTWSLVWLKSWSSFCHLKVLRLSRRISWRSSVYVLVQIIQYIAKQSFNNCIWNFNLRLPVQ